ncbi:glycosyltransferase family 2 protein [Methylomonas sp. MgM2]
MMNLVVNGVAAVLAGYVCLLMGMVILEVLAALGWRRKAVSDEGVTMPNTVVLVPAHNEEGEIGKTLQILQQDLPENTRILCVAHNCSDGTASVVRSMGAAAIEVKDAGTGGKPDALKAGLRFLDANPPEVVVVIDADCSVSKGAIRLLATRVKQLGHPVMGAYFFAAEADGHKAGGISSLALLLKNFIRPLGLHRLGLPCLLNGSGSAYPFQAIRQAPHGEGSIAEDYQLTLDLLDMGYITTFEPDARIDGRLPKRDATAQKQRRRWEHGHLFLSFNTAPRVLLQGLFRFQLSRLVLGLDLLVPPLAYLGLIVICAVFLNVAALAFFDAEPYAIWALGSGLFLFMSSLIMASFKFVGAKNTWEALWAVPGYLLWKLPIYRDFFNHRETRWMKTERD